MEILSILLLVLTSVRALEVSDILKVLNKYRNHRSVEKIQWRQSVCVIYGKNVNDSIKNKPISKLNDPNSVRLLTPAIFESLSVWNNWNPDTLALKDRVNFDELKGYALYKGSRDGQDLVITPSNPWYREKESSLDAMKIKDSPVIARLFTNFHYLGDEYPICEDYQALTIEEYSKKNPAHKFGSPNAKKRITKREVGPRFPNYIGERQEVTQEQQEISYKLNNESPNWTAPGAAKSIENVKPFKSHSSSTPSADERDEKNFPTTSGLVEKFFPNSVPQLLKVDYQGPIIFKLGIHQFSEDLPEKEQMSPVFDYFFKGTGTEHHGENRNIVGYPVQNVQSSTTEASGGVYEWYSKPVETTVSEGVKATTDVLSIAITEEPETLSTETTVLPETTTVEDGLSTENTDMPEDLSTEATETEDSLTESTQTEASLTEATEIPEDFSTESTEILETSTAEVFSTEEATTEMISSVLSTTQEIATPTTYSSEFDPSEGLVTTEPNESSTINSQLIINSHDEVAFTGVKGNESSEETEENSSEETEEKNIASVPTNDTTNSLLKFEDDTEAESNGQMTGPKLLPQVPAVEDLYPRQASEAIADAINAYEADGSPTAVERLHDILEATVNITGDVEAPDEAALDLNADAEEVAEDDA